jgi:hypothetical protein
MIALASSRILKLGARLQKGCRPSVRKNANRFGQDMWWLAKYAFFTRSILFFRLGG